MSYNPQTVSDVVAGQLLKFARHYVAKHSQADSDKPLSPEAREEVVARILYDWQTADYSEWQPEDDLHAVARQCRWWRIRGWNGETADDQREKRQRQRLAREQSQAGWDATPSTGTSEDSRTPTPLAILIAEEEATNGLRYVSDRQRKARRKAVRGRNRLERLLVVEGRYATHTAIRWEVVRIHGILHKGTVANRDIGKARTVPVADGLAQWALRDRDDRGRFVPNREPSDSMPWEDDGGPVCNLETRRRSVGQQTAADPAAYREALREYYASR